MKVIVKLLLLALLFFSLWFSLSQVDWNSVLKTEDRVSSTENKIGELIWKSLKAEEPEVENTPANEVVQDFLDTLCVSNNMDCEAVQIHVFKMNTANAFAIPGNRIIVTTGLIKEAEDPGELAGVIAHELAHVQLNHIMKKLSKEVGYAVLASAAGGSGGEVIRQALEHLSSSAYDRSLEKEADLEAVDYLINAQINPGHLADFMFRISLAEPDFLEKVTWINTHPESLERADYIIEYQLSREQDFEYKELLSSKEWREVQNTL